MDCNNKFKHYVDIGPEDDLTLQLFAVKHGIVLQSFNCSSRLMSEQKTLSSEFFAEIQDHSKGPKANIPLELILFPVDYCKKKHYTGINIIAGRNISVDELPVIVFCNHLFYIVDEKIYSLAREYYRGKRFCEVIIENLL